MGTVISKMRNGKPYLYYVESARVNGKPRIVNQIYIGPPHKVKEKLEQGKEATKLKPKRIQKKTWGKPIALFSIAEQLGLVDVINGVLGKKKEGYDQGELIVAAAIHRACDPGSKQSLPGWYEKTALSTTTGWNLPDDHCSQNWWNNFHDLSEDQLEELQIAIMKAVQAEFDLDTSLLLFDPTNFYTFIDRFHENEDQTTLPQFGKNKHRRSDLLQVNLAVVSNGIIPLLAKTYAGEVPDVKIFKELFPDWSQPLSELEEDSDQTLVFDRGNVSKDNLDMLEDNELHYVSTLKPYLHKDLIRIPLIQYTESDFTTSKCNELKVWRGKVDVQGRKRTVVMTYNEETAKREIRTFLHRVERQYIKAMEYIQDSVDTGKEKWAPSVWARLRKDLLDYYDLKGLIDASVGKKKGRGANGKLKVELKMNWNKFYYRIRKAGKRLICTSRKAWSSGEIVDAMSAMWQLEEIFRKLNNAFYLSMRPMYHWTDPMIRMHHFTVLLAMQLMALVYEKAMMDYSWPIMSFDEVFDHLENIDQMLLFFPRQKKADRMLTDMSEEQELLIEALGLDTSG
jgi:transposase